jgi:hypothetical protein
MLGCLYFEGKDMLELPDRICWNELVTVYTVYKPKILMLGSLPAR